MCFVPAFPWFASQNELRVLKTVVLHNGVSGQEKKCNKFALLLPDQAAGV